jgi:hypothetical protein
MPAGPRSTAGLGRLTGYLCEERIALTGIALEPIAPGPLRLGSSDGGGKGPVS